MLPSPVVAEAWREGALRRGDAVITSNPFSRTRGAESRASVDLLAAGQVMYVTDVCQRHELRSTSPKSSATGSTALLPRRASPWLNLSVQQLISTSRTKSTQVKCLPGPSVPLPTQSSDRETTGNVADLLVDTDVFIDHLRGAVELRAGRHRLHYSVVTRAELFAGNTATHLIAQLLAPFRELAVDRSVAERAGRIVREFSVRLPDALIAATALEHDLSVVTGNRKHFEPIRGIRLRALR